MLSSLPAALSVAAGRARQGVVVRRPRQIVVSSLELLQVLVADQTLVPQMVEETKVGTAGPECVSALEVFRRDVVHSSVPGDAPILDVKFPLAEGAPHRPRGLLGVEVAQTVGMPFLDVC